MAAKSRNQDEQLIEAVDLIAILTPPGCDGCYESEIFAGAYPDFAEEPAQDEEKPARQEDKSLNQLMQALAPGRPTPAAQTARPTPPPLPVLPALPSTPGNKSLTSSPPNLTPKLPAKEQKIAAENSPVASPPAQEKVHAARLTPIATIENDSLAAIAEEIEKCQKCELWQTRNKTVPGIGPQNAKLVFIGEAPGADEDSSGIPFVGKAGQHLDKILAAAGFKRDELYICNILKCRPPENRNPTIPEMVCCTPFLQRQLNLIKPQLIACLGNVAIKFVIGPDALGITRIHGQWFSSIFGIPTMAMYHPSFLVRSATREKGSPNWEMWQDIQTLKKRFDSLS